MGKGNPFKAITKSVEKAVKNVVSSPVKAVEGVLHGDVNKVLNAGVNGVTMGTGSLNDKSGIFDATETVGNVIGGITGVNAMKDALEENNARQAAAEKAAAEAQAKQQSEAKAAAISRRRADLSGETKTIYTSALGDVANAAAGKTKKKTLLGG